MLTKTAVADEVAAKLDGFSRRDITEVLEALAEVAEEQLHSGENFKIHGLVTLRPKYTAAKPSRPGRNPQTGEDMVYAAKPAAIGLAARPDAQLKKGMPGITTAAGKKLAAKFKK